MLSAGKCYSEHTHTHIYTGVCTIGSSNIVPHDLLLPWFFAASTYITMETQNYDWHGALSEVGQKRPSQAESDRIYL